MELIGKLVELALVECHENGIIDWYPGDGEPEPPRPDEPGEADGLPLADAPELGPGVRVPERRTTAAVMPNRTASVAPRAIVRLRQPLWLIRSGASAGSWFGRVPLCWTVRSRVASLGRVLLILGTPPSQGLRSRSCHPES